MIVYWSAIASFAWAVFGFLSLALTIDRHYHDVYGKKSAPLGSRYLMLLRALGWGGLLMSFAAAVSYKGWAVGPAAWMGILAVTAFSLMLLLAYKPHWLIKSVIAALFTAVPGTFAYLLL